MLNTIRQALPQSGNSKADMYIEMTEEGGITRVLGFYNSLKGVDKIGTIRSTREYFYPGPWDLMQSLFMQAGTHGYLIRLTGQVIPHLIV